MSDQPSKAEIFGSDRMWGLKELPLPEPVSWWPQAPGWYVVGAILAVALCYLGWRLWRRHQANAYRREALARLDAMSADPGALKELPVLLRSSALAAGSRQRVAGLQGEAWIAWLNETAGEPVFAPSDAETLALLAYADADQARIDSAESERLITASKRWMRMHHAAV